MSVDFRHLRAFHALADTLSFRRASERLHIAQPALSRTIKTLEETLGVQLFERTTRTTTLTDPGKVFLKHTQPLFDDLERAIDLTQRSERGLIGEIRIGFNDFAINGRLPGLVRDFRDQWPMIEVDLIDSTTPVSIDMVTDGKLDVALVTGYEAQPHLARKLVTRERLVCVVPAAHPLAQRDTVSISDLSDEAFIMGRWETWKSYNRLVNAFCTDHGFLPKVIQEAEHIDGIAGLVASTMGISLMADGNWIRSIEGLKALPLTNELPDIRTEVIWLESRYQKSESVRNFIDLV